MRKWTLAVLVSLAAMTAASTVPVAAQLGADNPRFGRWKIQSDAPPPSSNIMTYEPYVEDGKTGMRVTIVAVNAKGETRTWGYVTMFDGKFRPMTGDTNADSAAVTVIDSRTTKIENKTGDNIQTIINVLSEDGNTINNEYRSMRDGKEVVTHAVYKRIQ
ncbi:MAG: hypothetical protein AB7H88_21500 [Vicinamibacterales bacterium]